MAIHERDFERLMNQARIKLPGASDEGLKGELFDVVSEFFDVSNAWFEWMQIPIVANQQAYTVNPQKGGMIIRLVCVFDPNKVILPAHMAEIWPPGANIWLTWPQNINMTANAMFIKNIILPNTRDNIPDAPGWLLPTYERYILAGLLGVMMAQPGKPYTSPGQSTYHLKRFRDGMAVVKTAVARSNLVGGQSWRFPSQFRSNSQRGGVSTPFPTPTSWGV
jgi:hypothetical protein